MSASNFLRGGRQSPVPLFLWGFRECEKASVYTVFVNARECVQPTFHLVLSFHENKWPMAGFTASWEGQVDRGQQAAGEHLSSCGRQLGAARTLHFLVKQRRLNTPSNSNPTRDMATFLCLTLDCKTNRGKEGFSSLVQIKQEIKCPRELMKWLYCSSNGNRKLPFLSLLLCAKKWPHSETAVDFWVDHNSSHPRSKDLLSQERVWHHLSKHYGFQMNNGVIYWTIELCSNTVHTRGRQMLLSYFGMTCFPYLISFGTYFKPNDFLRKPN